MRKEEFLKELRRELKNVKARGECEKACQYYGELIDEAVESGKTEKEAVVELPLPKEIARRIIDGLDGSFDGGVYPAKNHERGGGKDYERGDKKQKSAGIIYKIIVFFAILIFVFPISAALISVLFAVSIACFSVVISFVICGIAIPIYAAAMGVIGQSLMIFFAYSAAGFMLLGLGLLGMKLIKTTFKALFGAIKSMGKATANLLRV